MGLFKKKQIIDKNGKIVKHKKVKVGIAFGGGGLRGIGHIGAIKAFEELGIKADYIAGTSAGSIIGSLLAYGLTSSQMISELKKLKVKDIRDSKFIWRPSNSENIEDVLKNIFKNDLMFSELKIPLTIVATNIISGEEVEITGGSVAKASSGSCAVPGIFTPVIFGDMHLVDGGLHNNVPADIVRHMGADVVIAIEVNRARGQGTESLKILDVLKTSLGIMMQANVEKKLEYADVIIKPDLEKHSSMKIGDIDEMINAGYEAVMSHKDEIVSLLTNKPKKKVKTLWTKLTIARNKLKNK